MREKGFMSTTKTAPKFVAVHLIKWDASLLSLLPASHAVTGCDTVKVSKGAKIRSRYNQVPHTVRSLGMAR